MNKYLTLILISGFYRRRGYITKY